MFLYDKNAVMPDLYGLTGAIVNRDRNMFCAEGDSLDRDQKRYIVKIWSDDWHFDVEVYEYRIKDIGCSKIDNTKPQSGSNWRAILGPEPQIKYGIFGADRVSGSRDWDEDMKEIAKEALFAISYKAYGVALEGVPFEICFGYVEPKCSMYHAPTEYFESADRVIYPIERRAKSWR